MLSVDDPADKADAEDIIRWLLATDKYGNKNAMARRLGIMYMIWNRQMWRAYDSPDQWRPYAGPNPHTDHIHFSLSWALCQGADVLVDRARGEPGAAGSAVQPHALGFWHLGAAPPRSTAM
ncbi:hypothetical protein [Kutzneria sp. 744]|uniref:hypothetical protein n=1 Tax=Kutzneria sp. (strain 744) TaxID=345341 RepID=UPI0004B17503|nr:hypothetical protein [Kutzneria sp. 744]